MKVFVDAKEFEKIDKELQYLKSHEVIVGVLTDEFYEPENGEKPKKIKEIAIYNEYGTRFIPSRPFFRTATSTRRSKREITAYAEKQAEMIVTGKKTAKQVLDSIGLYVVGRIKKNILKGNWTPNAPSTIRQKRTKKNNPLIETQTLLNSITYEIRRKN